MESMIKKKFYKFLIYAFLKKRIGVFTCYGFNFLTDNQNSLAPGMPNGSSGMTLPGQQESRRSLTPTPSSNSWHNCRKIIYVPRSAQKGYSVGHWPVPEAFWPDANDPSPTLVSLLLMIV